jgi:hypothetical protein
MNKTWFSVVMALAGVAAACGDGNLNLNVDVYSWLKGSGKDSVPYIAPPLTNDSASTIQKISLPGGLGSSVVDTVQVTGKTDFKNQGGGPGTISFQVYLAADSAGTYAAGRDSLLRPPISAAVSGSATTSSIFGAPNLSPKGDSLFTKSEVWVRVVARVNNATATLVQGTAVLTGLDLRVVVQDKVF